MHKTLTRKILKYSIIALVAVVLTVIVFFFSVYYGFFGALPGKKELQSIRNEEASLVYSSEKKIIGKYFAENRTNIQWKDIPKHLTSALIATEDRRFFSHKGYDAFSYFRVLFKSILLRDNSGGGSTLTQQLIKNLYGRKRHGILTVPVNKVKEAIIAARIEDIYNKEELLLLYLNSVPFGEDVYGIESASQRFFSKHAKDLKIEESAVLIGMLKANTYYNPVLNPENSRKRRDLVLTLMARQKYISREKADSLKKLPLTVNHERFNTSPAGYFVHQVRKISQQLLDSINKENETTYNLEKDGLRIYTTLNLEIQELASKAISHHISKMQKVLDKEIQNRKIKNQWLAKHKKNFRSFEKDKQKRKLSLFDWDGIKTVNTSRIDSLWHYYKMLHAAVLITNPKTGAVLSWIGGNHFQTLPFDMVLSHRQSASTFKPILYASAIENGLEACTYLENEQKTFKEFESWTPENFDKGSTPDSTVALWYSLIHSMNLPAIDLFFKLGNDHLSTTCKKLRLPEYTSNSPSIALGALDVSLYEMVRAYGAFANNGFLTDLTIIEKITEVNGKVLFKNNALKTSQVFDTLTVKTITAILQQAINQGTGVAIRGKFDIKAELAGKTGTAQNYSDAWFIAYTPKIVVGTWVGASTPDIHFYSRNGSGSLLAMPIAANILKNMEDNEKLRNTYLTSFNYPVDHFAFLECEPYKYTGGIKGFFEKLFDREEKVIKDTAQRKKKSFFKRIFGKQKEREQ